MSHSKHTRTLQIDMQKDAPELGTGKIVLPNSASNMAHTEHQRRLWDGVCWMEARRVEPVGQQHKGRRMA